MKFVQFSKKVRPDLIFFIIGFFIFPAVVIISIYTIFRFNDDIPSFVSYPQNEDVIPSQHEGNNEENISEERGEVNGGMTSSISTVRTGHSETGYLKSIENQDLITSTGNWIATEYSMGDIERSTYVVQLGDTLWQIAQAYYGNGSEWVKILNENSNSIGYLPDGEQALIVPGQILNLP